MATPTPTPTHTFFDTFCIVVLIVALALTFTDWLIGKSGRANMRSAAGDWWIFVEDTSFGQQLSLEANYFLSLYENVFERQRFMNLPLDRFDWWMRRFLFVVVPGVLAMAIATFVWTYLYGLGARLLPGQVGASQHVLILPMIISTTFGFMGIRLLGETLSIAARRGRSISFLISFSAVFIYAVGVAAIASSSVLAANFYEFHVRPLYQSNIVHSSWVSDVHIQVLGRTLDFHQSQFISVIACVFSTAATGGVLLTLLTVNLVFIFSKVFRFALKPFCSLLLQRFYDSDKGILTVIAVGGGALAKAIQEVLKFSTP